MEKEILITGEYKGKLMLDYIPCINYAMMLNDHMAFSKFDLKNESQHDCWKEIRISLSGDMLEPCQHDIPELRPGHIVHFSDTNLMPVASKLMTLTEAVQTSFCITVTVGGKTILQQSLPVMLMAYDQWHGTTTMPELLASFVTPNHPSIPAICHRASQYLEEVTGYRDLDPYLSMDCQRITSQIESVYRALLDEDITYCITPPSFEASGQRIRLVDKILKDKLGNCIELSLLLCSCLEFIGIRTVMVLYPQHAIMGAWIDPVPFLPMVCDNQSYLDVSILKNQRTLVLIEATALTRGESLSEAIRQGEEYFHQNTDSFEFFIDIYSARINKVRPLPHCIQSESGEWKVNEDINYDELFDELANKNPYDIHGTASSEKMKGKLQLWERKLLDLTLRNNLLNMKSGKHIVPLKDKSIEEILAHLVEEQLGEDIEEKEDFSTIKELYRASRTSLEENGANTLFLSIGTLRWYEVDSNKPFFAPILFIPIEIVRHGAKKYIIRVRDEESLVNITLIEMMRQTFELEIPELMPVPEDENEVIDWKRVFSIITTSISEINEKRPVDSKWEVVEECMIGIFSFSKFVMWNDIHSHANVLESHPLLRSFMEGRPLLPESKSIADARELDRTSNPSDYAIPIDADSSQMEAIVNSGKGNSFILYGPPGTGKSQTITNMIANALYQDKRVLFVAEKKAALEVVQQRLKRIGLDPFCLELHSNKVDKKSFLAQIEDALDVPLKTSSSVFAQKADELFARRQELNSYVEAMHCERSEGQSLFDFINHYLDIDSDTMKLSYKEVKNLSSEQVKDIYDQCVALDTVKDIIGEHPSSHPLLGLYPKVNTAENQQTVTDCLARLSLSIATARKKEKTWWNRWFFKRTALEILQRDEELQKFLGAADVDIYIKDDIDILDASVSSWNQNTDKLRLWYHYSTRAMKLKSFCIPAILQYYLQGNSGTETAKAFLKGYNYRMAMNIVDNDPALRSFNGMLFEDIITKYRTLTKQFQELTKEELVCRLSQRIPRAQSADKQAMDEITFLRKRIAAHGRAYSVRRMLDNTQHILPRLCPCMLMSPLSVAQYLEMSGQQFDLVIFDEASQMPTSEAVGAIARGKTTVVVGDPKQMPPTSFFMTNSTNDDDADIDDLESILDDCISMSMPGHYLSWHYRSKHESLISFSNTQFYDGKLVTFPSVDDQERKVTLQLVDGYYDFGKSRSNKAEAKAIVQDVIERLERMEPKDDGSTVDPQRSIGIVAFSKVQSVLIEDMLLDALSKRPELEAIALKSDEPIFVKNLENVQGDERDIILFSVGYGPDKTGKVSMNFGPLNQIGGERRLNVAVSRARYEMKVFSTLQAHHIDPQRTSAKGVLSLKRFLEYAETGILPCPSAQQGVDETDPISRVIVKKLREEGYEVHTNVGRSMYKVDIAIVDKENPNRYERGIILDDLSYYHTPTARDREIVQPNILSLLGWNIEHRWTADYITNM